LTWVEHVPVYQPTGSQFVPNQPTGMCTLLALAACDIVSKGLGAWVGDAHAINPNPASVANLQAVMWRIYLDAYKHGNCTANGSATQQGMIREAGRIALPIKDILWFQDPMPVTSWVTFLRKYVAEAQPHPYPVLVQCANGRALADSETGKQDEADLENHAFALYGTKTEPKSPAAGGYVGCDGDNPISDTKSVVFSRITLINAQIISMIAFDYVRSAH